jgi:hypothetical protein
MVVIPGAKGNREVAGWLHKEGGWHSSHVRVVRQPHLLGLCCHTNSWSNVLLMTVLCLFW